MEKNIIKKISPKRFDVQVEKHVAAITGRRSYVQPTYYLNNETGEAYLHIAGGVGWPHIGEPGYICIVGVIKGDAEDPEFKVLQEFEGRTITRILATCLDLRKKYGGRRYSELFQYYYGDFERFWPTIAAFNSRLKGKELYFTPPNGFELKNRLQVFTQQLRELLTPNEKGEKRLFLNKCNIARAQIASILQAEAATGDIYKHPVIFALGGLIYSLSESQPWRVTVPGYGIGDADDFCSIFGPDYGPDYNNGGILDTIHEPALNPWDW